MNILDNIDATLDHVTSCMCGCGTPLNEQSASPWYANDSCLRAATQAVTGADNYPKHTHLLDEQEPDEELCHLVVHVGIKHERVPWYRRWLRFGRFGRRPGTPA